MATSFIRILAISTSGPPHSFFRRWGLKSPHARARHFMGLSRFLRSDAFGRRAPEARPPRACARGTHSLRREAEGPPKRTRRRGSAVAFDLALCSAALQGGTLCAYGGGGFRAGSLPPGRASRLLCRDSPHATTTQPTLFSIRAAVPPAPPWPSLSLCSAGTKTHLVGAPAVVRHPARPELVRGERAFCGRSRSPAEARAEAGICRCS